MTPQKKFLDELNIFRNEVNSVLKFLYVELAIHAIASKDKKVVISLNASPTFWNTILSALQHSTFITLGRIFDTDSAHSIHTLRKHAENNKELFSKESFINRWHKDEDKKEIDNYVEEYTKNFYVLTDKDFRKLRKIIKQQHKIYTDIYSPIRHQFAHRKNLKNEDVKVLFDKVNIRNLEKFCVHLKNIHEAFWQLYHNGRPLFPIKQEKYSTQSILRKKYEPYDPTPLNSAIIGETKIALNLLKLGSFHQKDSN